MRLSSAVIGATLALTALACMAPAEEHAVSMGASLPLVTAADCPAGYNVIVAAPNQLTIVGTNGDDCIIGNALPNRIRGRNGDDFIAGGLGNDILTGDGGDDELYGEDGNDRVYGRGGDDWIDGGAGDDLLRGNSGADTIYGGPGNDNIRGGSGADWIDGGSGDDRIHGGSGTDTIAGGGGDDILRPGSGSEGELSFGAILDTAPTIVSVVITPDGYMTLCETVSLSVDVDDPEGDPSLIAWAVLAAPTGASPTLTSAGANATFATDTIGPYELRVTASTPHGAPASLTFPIHVSPCAGP